MAAIESTFYRCRDEYSGLTTDQAKCLHGLERGNTGRNRLMAEAGL
jgi:hypothetical protein